MKTFKEFMAIEDTIDEAEYKFDIEEIKDLGSKLFSDEKQKISAKEAKEVEKLRKKLEDYMSSIKF